MEKRGKKIKDSQGCLNRAINSSRRKKSKAGNIVKPSLVALAVAQSLSMTSAQAATIHVGGPNGAGCGFTAAILAANNDATPSNSQCVAGSGDDVIELHRDITLRKAWRENVNGVQQDTFFGTPLITSNVTINGNGHTISRDPNAAGFGILSSRRNSNGLEKQQLSLNEVTLSNGAASPDAPPQYHYYRNGIALDLSNVALTLNDVNISNNNGGPTIYGYTTSIDISNSVISNNDTPIWLVYGRTIDIAASSISNNNGTALHLLQHGSMNITDSEINNNRGNAIFTYTAVANATGEITIHNSSISNNKPENVLTRAAVELDNPISVTISDSDISNNASRALQIRAGYDSFISGSHPVIIDSSTLSNNGGTAVTLFSTSDYGTSLDYPSLTILNSSLINNTTNGDGGAIMSLGDTSSLYGPSAVIRHTIINSTISGNSAAGSGGAIYLANYDYGTAVGARVLTLINTTIVDNSASYGGGIATNEGKVYINSSNSIIAGNSASVSGSEINHLSGISFPSDDLTETNNNVLGSSLESNSQAFNGFTPSASDITATIDGTDPAQLDDIVSSLQDNGGATQTHALPAGSPAIDAGDLDTCLNDPINALDQRGEARGEAGLCDVGAYEMQGAVGDLPTISIDSIEVSESDSTATLTISLSSPQTERIPVDFQTVDGTATEGLDYTGRSGTMAFAPGQTQKVRTIQLLDDNLGESTEAFSLMLSNPVGATLAEAIGEVTILDDDGLPTITIESADHSVNEGDSGNSRRIVYTISLSSEQTEPVSVDFQTMDQSAVGGVDYEIRSGSMTFMPGQTSKIRAIKVLGDTEAESDETFKLVLSNPSRNAAVDVDDADSIGIIIDND